MRIVHYISEIRREHGGTVRFVIDLCSALVVRGHDVTVLVWNDVDVPPAWNGVGLTPRVVVMPRPRGPLQRPTPAARALAERVVAEADALHLHVVWDPLCQRLARLARRHGVPWVVTPHGMLDAWSMRRRSLKKRAYLALGGRRMLEQSAVVHCASAGEAEECARQLPRGRTCVVPLLTDVEPYRELPDAAPARAAFAIEPQRPTLLFVGRLHAVKGLDRLVQAVGRLHERGCPARLLVAGNDEEGLSAALSAEARAAGVGDAVQLLGFVDGALKRSLYRAADVFVLPSVHESWGYALFEALLCGTPVVTTRGVKTWPELESSGGAVIAEDRPEALADAVLELLSAPDRGAGRGAAGRRWSLERLDPERVMDAWEAMYREAARGQRPRSATSG